MRPVLAVVDPRGSTPGELRATLSSLRGQVGAVHVLGEGEPALEGVVAVLAVPAGVVLARGAVSRLARRATVPGRRVTRVLLPGVERPVAVWRLEAAREAGIGVDEIATGGIELDRSVLDPGNGRARAWVPADEIGVARVAEAGGAWAWVAGVRLGASLRLSVVRSRLGQVRRARALRAQREGRNTQRDARLRTSR